VTRCEIFIIRVGYLNAVEVDIETGDLRGANIRQFDELGTAFERHMQRHLEMILFLTDERIVLRREVEALVSVHAEPDHWSAACTQYNTIYSEQANVQTNTESVHCISIAYSIYVRINKISKLCKLVIKIQKV